MVNTAIRCLAALALAACAGAREPEPTLTDDAAGQVLPAGKAAVGSRHMIVAAHPLAARAGRDILRQGGSAVDAAIAAQMVLNLVEPQSSGIGGGGFLLHFERETGRVRAYDGRETAPAGASPTMFLGADGQPLPFLDAAASGLSVGVPGLVRMLELAHARHGRLPWALLFQPAITLAEDGFPLPGRLHGALASEERLQSSPLPRARYFDAEGRPLAAGTSIRNRALAETFRRLARFGPEAFYEGSLARQIGEAVAAHPERPGSLRAADLAGYRALERDPVCGPYRVWIICGMPPPSSGGVAVLQILTLLEPFDLAAEPPLSPRFAHLFAEAGRLAFADRGRYLADPDRVEVPVTALLDRRYLAARAALIRPDRASAPAQPGELPLTRANPVPQPGPLSTTHISIVDGEGNAVALTSSVESAFGSRIEIAGFLLNNQLTDFAFLPEREGRPVANRAEPGKRPLSAMAPTLIFTREGRLAAVLGSPGGASIIPYVAEAVIALLDWGLAPHDAAALGHVANRNGPTDLETGTPAAALGPGLAALGHEVRAVEMPSGLHIIRIEGGRLLGGADPRRDGVALGD